MKFVAFIILVTIGILAPASSSAQLSDRAINEIAENQADKWSQYLHFSKLRKDKFKNIYAKHERKKSKIILTSLKVKDLLLKEDKRFMKELGTILTPSEKQFYISYNQSANENSKSYFNSLMKAIDLEDRFVQAFNDLQYNEVFPALMTFRQELEADINSQDKITLDSIRLEVFEKYDNCLLFCIADEAKDSTIFENLNNLLPVDLNKGLSDPNSDLSKLIKLTRKYEDQINAIQASHSNKYDFWRKKTVEIENDYLLENYVENIRKLKKNSPFASLADLESEAIFLLLEPTNINRSRKIISLGFHNLY